MVVKESNCTCNGCESGAQWSTMCQPPARPLPPPPAAAATAETAAKALTILWLKYMKWLSTECSVAYLVSRPKIFSMYAGSLQRPAVASTLGMLYRMNGCTFYFTVLMGTASGFVVIFAYNAYLILRSKQHQIYLCFRFLHFCNSVVKSFSQFALQSITCSLCSSTLFAFRTAWSYRATPTYDSYH